MISRTYDIIGQWYQNTNHTLSCMISEMISSMISYMISRCVYHLQKRAWKSAAEVALGSIKLSKFKIPAHNLYNNIERTSNRFNITAGLPAGEWNGEIGLKVKMCMQFCVPRNSKNFCWIVTCRRLKKQLSKQFSERENSLKIEWEKKSDHTWKDEPKLFHQWRNLWRPND